MGDAAQCCSGIGFICAIFLFLGGILILVFPARQNKDVIGNVQLQQDQIADAVDHTCVLSGPATGKPTCEPSKTCVAGYESCRGKGTAAGEVCSFICETYVPSFICMCPVHVEVTEVPVDARVHVKDVMQLSDAAQDCDNATKSNPWANLHVTGWSCNSGDTPPQAVPAMGNFHQFFGVDDLGGPQPTTCVESLTPREPTPCVRLPTQQILLGSKQRLLLLAAATVAYYESFQPAVPIVGIVLIILGAVLLLGALKVKFCASTSLIPYCCKKRIDPALPFSPSESRQKN